jgi:DNA oxidative demethylase
MAMSQILLFATNTLAAPEIEKLQEGVTLIHHAFDSEKLFEATQTVIKAAPLRHMETPGGKRMSVAMTNCGSFGWTSSRAGYAYSPVDPETQLSWPPMPPLFLKTAADLATQAGHSEFVPDACLINRYLPGAQMGLHQDRDERDLSQPIVSLSLGLSAQFVIGGLKRSDSTQSIELRDGDAIIFGGAARLLFHGVRTVKVGQYATLNNCRINLTFRMACQGVL